MLGVTGMEFRQESPEQAPGHLPRPLQPYSNPMQSALNPVLPAKPKQASGYRTHSE